MQTKSQMDRKIDFINTLKKEGVIQNEYQANRITVRYDAWVKHFVDTANKKVKLKKDYVTADDYNLSTFRNDVNIFLVAKPIPDSKRKDAKPLSPKEGKKLYGDKD